MVVRAATVLLIALMSLAGTVHAQCTVNGTFDDCQCPMNVSSSMGQLDQIKGLFRGLFSRAEELYREDEGEGYQLDSWNVVNSSGMLRRCANGVCRRRRWSNEEQPETACCDS